MAVSKEDILEAISNMSVMDVVDLVKMMEDKFGVSAAAVAVAAPAAGAAAGAAVEEKTILLLIEARNRARAEKNFKEADRVRDELLTKGILLEDGPDGTIWRQQ